MNSKIVDRILEISFLFLIVILYLSPGTGYSVLAVPSFIILLSYALLRKREFLTGRPFIFLIPLAGLLIFEIVRVILFRDNSEYRQSVAEWGIFGIFLITAFQVFASRKSTQTLLNISAWIGFFLAINAIPGLLLEGPSWRGYAISGDTSYFFPALYFHPVMWDLLTYAPSSANTGGDMLAFGFFSALGLAIYYLLSQRDKNWQEESRSRFLSSLFLRIFFALVIAAGILLFFSRGTIAFFGISLIVWAALFLMKFPSKRIFWSFAVGILILFGFLSWAGNLDKASKEVGTLSLEQQALKGEVEKGSILWNKEGAKRAVAMYQDHPVWGVGRGGYYKNSLDYATSDKARRFTFISGTSMCHFLNVLAEEGAGAFLYFVFILFYFFEMIKGLFQASSRFQFMAALSLMAPVLFLLGHSSIGYVLDDFYRFCVVAVYMGASLAVLRKDFRHEG